MPRLKVKNLKNEDVGDIELNDAIFGAEVKEHLLHEIVRMQLNRRRVGSACTKERSAVSGGGKKPFKQKGTGRARQGSERSPNHVGGGVTFGPRPRSYDFSPPKKVRRGAMISALSLYAKENRIVVLDAFEMEGIKTKSVNETLGILNVRKALIVDLDQNDNLRYSTRNLALHRFTTPEGLNVLDILKHDQLVMTKRAVDSVEQRFERPVRERKVEA